MFGGAGMGAAIGAGINATADMFSNIQGSIFADYQAKKSRNWAQRLYENRYGLTMADMRRAGLNPILAAGSGLGGSGVPSAAMASFAGRRGPDLASAAKAMGLLKSAEFKNIEEGALARDRGSLANTEQDILLETMAPVINSARSKARLDKANAIAVELENTLRKADADFYQTPTGQKIRAVERTKNAISPFIKPR